MGSRAPRILVVDDERFFREAIAEILTERGFSCVTAADGEAALEIVGDPAIGVVVLDIALPGIDGIEVLKRLRELQPDVRVIVVSASNDQELVLEALRLGACDYLVKPLHDEELALAVDRAAQSHRLVADFRELRDRLDRLEPEPEPATDARSELAPGPGDRAKVARDLDRGTPPPLRATGTAAGQDPDDGDAGQDGDAELARAVCEAMVSEAEPARVLGAVLRPLAGALAAAPVSLYLLDANSQELRLEEEWDAGLRSDRPVLPTCSGLTGSVLQTGCLVATPSPDRDPRFDALVDTPEDGRARPLLCVPLRIRGKVVGVARVFFEDGAAASARTGEVLSAALSAAVRNVLLYRSLVESIEEVAAVRREALGLRSPSPARIPG